MAWCMNQSRKNLVLLLSGVDILILDTLQTTLHKANGTNVTTWFKNDKKFSELVIKCDSVVDYYSSQWYTVYTVLCKQIVFQ